MDGKADVKYQVPKVSVLGSKDVRGGTDSRVDFIDQPGDDPSGFSPGNGNGAS